MNVNFLKSLCLLAISFLLLQCASLKKEPVSPGYAREPKQGPVEEREEDWDLDFDKPWAGKEQPAVSKDEGEESPFTKKFEDDTELDGILSPQPIQVALMENPKENTSPEISMAPKTEKNKSSDQNYRIQLLTVAEFETAQAKKRAFSNQIGAAVDIFFDAPFYKLRFGHFKSKREADEKLLDLMDIGLQGFVIKE